MKTTELMPLGPIHVVALVFVPGVLIAALYFAAGPLFLNLGLPSFCALLLAIVVILVPFESAVLLREGKRLNGRYSLKGVIPWTDPMPIFRFVAWMSLLLVWNFAVFMLLSRFDKITVYRLFSWFPKWALPPLNLYPVPGDYSTTVSASVVGAGFVLAGVVAPIVEELYFRGYLLPRMRFAGRYAPVMNAMLFSAYHLTLPWHFLSRTIAVIPIAYVASRTRNVYVGMVAHASLNVVSAWLFVSGRH